MDASRIMSPRGPFARSLGSAVASFLIVAPFFPNGWQAAALSSALNAAANFTQPDFSAGDSGPDEDQGSARRILWTVNGTQAIALLEHAAHRHGEFPSAAFVGAFFFVACAGIALRAWAVRTLDRHFTWHVTIVEGHRLVTSGPYRWFRHPSYVGALTAYVAFPLAIGSYLAALLALPLLIDAFRRRVRIEEKRLSEHFGSEWTTFASRVASWWPGS